MSKKSATANTSAATVTLDTIDPQERVPRKPQSEPTVKDVNPLGGLRQMPTSTYPSEEKVESNPYDIRLQAGISYGSLTSDSSYSPRDYQGQFLLYRLAVAVQTTAKQSLYFRMDSSTSFAVEDATSGRTSSDFQYQWTELGLQYSEDFADYKGVQWTLGWRQRNLKPARTAEFKMGSHTESLVLGFDLPLQKGSQPQWQISARLYPLAKHRELYSQWQHASGTLERTQAAELGVTYKLNLDKHHAIQWQYQYFWEENQFSGESSAADPIQSTSIRGVTVRTHQSFWGLQYQWQY